MLFFPFFYALFFWKAYATKVNYAHHLCSFFLDMPPSMLRFGGGIMLQMPFYATHLKHALVSLSYVCVVMSRITDR